LRLMHLPLRDAAGHILGREDVGNLASKKLVLFVAEHSGHAAVPSCGPALDVGAEDRVIADLLDQLAIRHTAAPELALARPAGRAGTVPRACARLLGCLVVLGCPRTIAHACCDG